MTDSTDNQPHSYTRLQEVLSQLRDLLGKYSESDRQAFAGFEHVTKTLALCDAGKADDLKDALNALEFWGGAGSIFDLIIGSSAEETRATVLKDKLLRQVVEEMFDLKLITLRAANRVSDLDWLIEVRGG